MQADLSRTPVSGNQRFDQLPIFQRNSTTIATHVSFNSKLMYLDSTIASFPKIAFQFPIDGTFMTSQYPTDFTRIFIGFPQCLNLITFGLVELVVVSHQCLSFFQG